MQLTGDLLSNMSIAELEQLYSTFPNPTTEQKERALKLMDSGIYDKQGNLIGDKFLEEDAYEE